jgi:hypothetical protein
MHGFIGKMTAVPGKRDALVDIMMDVIAKDSDDANGIWITEVWTDESRHGTRRRARP